MQPKSLNPTDMRERIATLEQELIETRKECLDLAMSNTRYHSENESLRHLVGKLRHDVKDRNFTIATAGITTDNGPVYEPKYTTPRAYPFA